RSDSCDTSPARGWLLRRNQLMSPRQANDEQAMLWNGVSGLAWVETQALLDRVLEPFEELLSEAAAVRAPTRLLDVGCGTGPTTIGAARRIGSSGRCVGIDISQ